jgi:hypothetical protein
MGALRNDHEETAAAYSSFVAWICCCCWATAGLLASLGGAGVSQIIMMPAVSLLRQEQPRLRHVDQQRSIQGIRQAFRDSKALQRMASVLIYQHECCPHRPR